MNRTFTPRSMVFISFLGALSFLLMSIEVPLPFAPAYMKFEISDLPALFGGFFLGPLAGTMACLIKILLKLIVIGTHSALVGEMMNLFCSMAFVLTAAWYYHFHYNKKGALQSLVLASLLGSAFAVFTIILPSPCMCASMGSLSRRFCKWPRRPIRSSIP